MRGICPFPPGPTALPFSGRRQRGAALTHFIRSRESLRVCQDKDLNLGLSILLVGPPTPTSPSLCSFELDPPPGPQPKGNTREDLGLTQDPKANVGKGVGQNVGDPCPTPLKPREPVERGGALEQERGRKARVGETYP